jgi:uncharacterized protein GlcG (DUF336 family)
MAAPWQALPVRLERAPHRRAAFAVSNASKRAVVAVGGGVPIKVGNEVIGAVGVSGAPGGEKDEACANAGIAKVAAIHARGESLG